MIVAAQAKCTILKSIGICDNPVYNKIVDSNKKKSLHTIIS